MTEFPPTGDNRRSIPSLFAPHPNGPTAASMMLPFTIQTPPRRWAYAARFDRAAAAPERGAVIVRVELQVNVGVVGVGCLNQQQNDFIDEEFTAAAPAPQVVELAVADAAAVHSLIIRNGWAEGASEARILSIACYALDTDDRRAPPLSQPSPLPGWERYYGTRGTTAVEKVRVQQFNALQQSTVLRWVDGAAIRIVPGDQLSRALFVSGSYEPNTLTVLRRLLRPGDVCFDVGANAGVVTLAASQWVAPGGHVYSFEPSEREFARLVDNLELNAVSGVTPVRAALRDRSGRVSLRVAASSHGGLNTLGDRFAYDGVDMAAVEDVEALTLDEFVERNAIGRIAVVKLDVEGAEGAVLLGAHRVLQEQRPALIIEVFAKALAANAWAVDDVQRLLRQARYRIFLIDETTATLTPVENLNAINERNVVALPEERESNGMRT